MTDWLIAIICLAAVALMMIAVNRRYLHDTRALSKQVDQMRRQDGIDKQAFGVLARRVDGLGDEIAELRDAVALLPEQGDAVQMAADVADARTRLHKLEKRANAESASHRELTERLDALLPQSDDQAKKMSDVIKKCLELEGKVGSHHILLDEHITEIAELDKRIASLEEVKHQHTTRRKKPS